MTRSSCLRSSVKVLTLSDGGDFQESFSCRVAAARLMKIFPLNKGGGAKRPGVVRSVLLTGHDNPLKASPFPPFVRGIFSRVTL